MPVMPAWALKPEAGSFGVLLCFVGIIRTNIKICQELFLQKSKKHFIPKPLLTKMQKYFNIISTMRKKLLIKLQKDAKKYGVMEMSRRLRWPYMPLYRLITGKNAGHITLWDRIEAYYKD